MSTTYAKALIQHRGRIDPWGRTRAGLEEHAALVDALNEQAKENWENPAFHRQVAADIATSLDYGFTFDNLFSTYIETVNVGEFDRVILRERRGLKVFSTARGGYVEESQIRDEAWTLPRDTMGFHVSEMTDKLRANFATTIEALVTLGQERLNAEANRRLYTLLGTALPAGSPYEISAPSLTKADLDAALREVRDAIKPDGRGPVPVTILGRALQIDAINDFFGSGFYPETNEEIIRTGKLGTYKGANVVLITNYTDEDGVSYIPDNELWVFGGLVGKFAFYGGLRVKSWEENTVDYTHYRAVKDLGGALNHPEQARVFRFTG